MLKSREYSWSDGNISFINQLCIRSEVEIYTDTFSNYFDAVVAFGLWQKISGNAFLNFNIKDI